MEELNEILAAYKKADPRHWYTQGSNNFQFSPQIAPEDDFYSGVRLARERLFRGSYAMCDAPQGQIQTKAPGTSWDYDSMIRPGNRAKSAETSGEMDSQNGCAAAESSRESGNMQDGQKDGGSGKVQIQYGTTTKEVDLVETDVLIPEIPVVSHEIGQYCIYPDYRDITKYDGVLRADCLDIFRDRLEKKGMLPLAERFFEDSGALAVQCYKEELEAALRSDELAGFQILDLQDFMGQGIAMVGVLNAFMENKGLITAEKWRQFCADAVVMARFERYVGIAGESMPVSCQCAWYRGEEATDQVTVSLSKENQVIWKQSIGTAVFTENGLYDLGAFELPFPNAENPYSCVLYVKLERLGIENQYEFWVYPHVEAVSTEDRWVKAAGVAVTSEEAAAKCELAAGRQVILLPEKTVRDGQLESAYCTDFWCYPMFRSISEGMKKPLPIGTLGLTIQKGHPVFAKFPCHSFTTPQWFDMVEGGNPELLEKEDVTMLAQVIDNVERNNRLGFIYEKQDGRGRMLVCHGGLLQLQQAEEPHRAMPARWLIRSLLSYAESWQEVRS